MRSHRQSMRDNIRDRNCTFVGRWNRILALFVGRENRPHVPSLDQGKQLFGMPRADRTRMDRAHQRTLCLSVFHMPPITQMVASDPFFRPIWLGCRGRTHTYPVCISHPTIHDYQDPGAPGATHTNTCTTTHCLSCGECPRCKGLGGVQSWSVPR